MSHVTNDLGRWLGGELDQARRRAVDEHLATCAACRREADALRAVWDDLALAEAPGAAPSAWPAVQARTFGAQPSWFFAGRPVLRAGLAVAAVACGLLAAVLVPGTGADKGALDGTLYASASRVLDVDGSSPVDVWLAMGSDDGEVGR